MAIVLDNVKKSYRDAEGRESVVLSIASLEVADGAQVCLVGGSGTGKTTLLNVIAGITSPTSGRVLFDDVDITSMSESRRDVFRAKHIGYVFQTFNLLQGLSALENVMVAAGFAGQHGSPVKERASMLLRRMGLEHRMHARPGAMSVGEQQRVAIARAVMNHPKVVLADEPTANLDEKNGDEVLSLLRETAGAEKSILVLVTHETRVRQRFEVVKELERLTA